MTALSIVIAVAYLFLVAIFILWVVMPIGIEPGVGSRLQWENLLPSTYIKLLSGKRVDGFTKVYSTDWVFGVLMLGVILVPILDHL